MKIWVVTASAFYLKDGYYVHSVHDSREAARAAERQIEADPRGGWYGEVTEMELTTEGPRES